MSEPTCDPSSRTKAGAGIDHAGEHDPISSAPGFHIEKTRSWGPISAHVDGLTLTDLAEVACLSPYHFSRSFKLAVGVGPQRYVMRRRLDRAKTLLRRSRKPLAVIAQEAGFADQSHLSSIFRREMGVTPGRFRAEMA
jgi:AraC-like DNA-binding protein